LRATLSPRHLATPVAARNDLALLQSQLACRRRARREQILKLFSPFSTRIKYTILSTSCRIKGPIERSCGDGDGRDEPAAGAPILIAIQPGPGCLMVPARSWADPFVVSAHTSYSRTLESAGKERSANSNSSQHFVLYKRPQAIKTRESRDQPARRRHMLVISTSGFDLT